MPIAFLIGRVVFVAYFIYAGLQRLMSVAGTAEYFAQRFTVPPAFMGFVSTFESTVGLSAMQTLALLAGAIELAAGLLIAFNVGTRVMALVLIVMTALAVYYGNDFWSTVDGLRDASLREAMLRVSLIGGLIVFVGLGSWRPGEPDDIGHV